MKNRHDKEYSRLINCSRWRKLRLIKIQNNPLCEQCEKEGELTLAVHVHHIIPLESATGLAKEQLAYNYNNLEALCEECHIKAHQKRSGDTEKIVGNFFDRF